jgi:XRE family transcriptional regulator, stress-response regulator
MLLRDALGETLRDARTRQNRTLRDVSTAANVSLGYLSEVERGRKEASSELLASICHALDVRLADILDEASTTLRSSAGTVRASVSTGPKVAVTANSTKAGVDGVVGDASLRIVLPYSLIRSAPSVA